MGSSDIVEILVRAYSEGKQVRDIYAKTPVDYASELRGKDRSGVIAVLERSFHSHSERSFARSIGGSEASSINLIDAVSESSKSVQRGTRSSNMKLEQVRSLSMLYGCEKSKMSQDEQKKKMDLLQQEVKTLKSLHATHSQKKTMLLEKVEMLEREKVNARTAISKIDQKNSARVKQELTAAMVEQEIKYKAMLSSEQKKVENLAMQAK